MAEGDLTRALHVATTIRVLVHETGRQKPLLKELRSNYLDLPIMEWFPKPPESPAPGVQAVTFYCPISAKISVSEGKTTISLNTEMNAPEYKASSLGAWWGHPCMVLPGLGPFFRSELILNLADKEGAHVDANIGERYRLVLESQFIRTKMPGADGPLNVSRLVGGKCGVEMLDYLDKNFPGPQTQPARV
jgi:hypothetical protein